MKKNLILPIAALAVIASLASPVYAKKVGCISLATSPPTEYKHGDTLGSGTSRTRCSDGKWISDPGKNIAVIGASPTFSKDTLIVPESQPLTLTTTKSASFGKSAFSK